MDTNEELRPSSYTTPTGKPKIPIRKRKTYCISNLLQMLNVFTRRGFLASENHRSITNDQQSRKEGSSDSTMPISRYTSPLQKQPLYRTIPQFFRVPPSVKSTKKVKSKLVQTSESPEEPTDSKPQGIDQAPGKNSGKYLSVFFNKPKLTQTVLIGIISTLMAALRHSGNFKKS